MGWSIGYDSNWSRDIGYGVTAYCDHPKCNAVIDRGLANVCANEEVRGGENGCGLYFCYHHLSYHAKKGFCCPRCFRGNKPYAAKKDHPDWIRHKLTDESWVKWREENSEKVAELNLT